MSPWKGRLRPRLRRHSQWAPNPRPIWQHSFSINNFENHLTLLNCCWIWKHIWQHWEVIFWMKMITYYIKNEIFEEKIQISWLMWQHEIFRMSSSTDLSLVWLLQHIVKFFLGSQQLQVSMLGLRNWAPGQFSLDFNLRCFCSLDRTPFQILTWKRFLSIFFILWQM